jgi:hypothetical protein
VSDGHGPFGHHVSYFIEANLPLILKRQLKEALDDFYIIEASGSFINNEAFIFPQFKLNIIDEVN